IKFEQTIAEWVFDLKLRPARFRRDAEIIEQRPDYPVTVFDVVVAGRGEQFPNPAGRLHGAAFRGSVGERAHSLLLTFEDGCELIEHLLQPILRLGHPPLIGGVLLRQFVYGLAVLPWVDSGFI